MRLVVALGGNALLHRGESPGIETQRQNVRTAAEAIARMADDHEVVITHGNGPQVGLLALQTLAYKDVPPYPLDVLGAESEGMLGYLLEQEISNQRPNREVCALITRVEVDANDDAFAHPVKPIGPYYQEAAAKALTLNRGWDFVQTNGEYRRAVASPTPRRIMELETIRLLMDAGHIVVCSGGGGIPVVLREDGHRYGIEAVIDKDHSAALLAEGLGADALLLLTDVAGVFRDWPVPAEQFIRSASPDDLDGMTFDESTMGPKVEAACHFVRSTSGWAGIGALEKPLALLADCAGTRIGLERSGLKLTQIDRTEQ